MSLEELIDSYDPNAPLAEASTIPASWYLDGELAELERKAVFAGSWQVVGRADQVQEPGQYLTCDAAGEPLVVVRGNDGNLRGFFNVCRHHAAAVMTEPAGKASQLQCPYHGWTYSLEGALKAAPDLGGICNFDRAAMGLIPIEIAVWKRWIFAKVDRGRAPLPVIPELDVTDFQWVERRHYLMDCNWKVFVDNYLDGGYHLPHLHKRLNGLLDYSDYQIELGDRHCLQWSPYRNDGRALYYWIYPNFMINRYPDAMDTNLVLPRGVSRTEVIFDFYFTGGPDAGRIAASETIQEEDAAVCKSVQHGLASCAYTSGRLSVRRESGEHLFHRLLHADLKTGRAKSGPDG